MSFDPEVTVDTLLRQMIFRGNPTLGSQLVDQHPQLKRFNFLTAVATGQFDAVEKALRIDPSLASRASGPLQWEPLLHLAYSRLPGHEQHGLAIARLLLDHGADVHARWMDDWGNPFSVIAGLIGEGEGVKPPHPEVGAIVQLCLDLGAEPFDTQVLYNTSIVRDETHWLEVLWERSEQCNATDKWRAIPAAPIAGKTAMSQLDYLLGNAVAFGHLARANWLLRHGAYADALHSYTARPLRELALSEGHLAIAELLREYSARD